MPGFLLHQNATVQCAHQGRAQPGIVSTKVFVGGQPIVTQPGPWTIAGCPLVPQAGGPCVTASFTSGATRVFATGQPVLLLDSQATCAPTGVPVVVTVTQTRVTGT